MVDSGAMGNFIHPRFVQEHGLTTKERTPLVVNDVNGRLLSRVDRQTEVRMSIAGHSEMITFDVAPLGKHNIVLGLPWLQHHDPIMQWSSGKITFTSDHCEQHCLAVPASTFLSQRPIVPTVALEPPDVDPEAELLAIEGAGFRHLSYRAISRRSRTLSPRPTGTFWMSSMAKRRPLPSPISVGQILTSRSNWIRRNRYQNRVGRTI